MSPEELTLSKDSLVRSLPAQLRDERRYECDDGQYIYIYDLGVDYYSKLAARMSAVTTEQVRGVAQKYVVPEKLVVVAVGDKAKVGPALRS